MGDVMFVPRGEVIGSCGRNAVGDMIGDSGDDKARVGMRGSADDDGVDGFPAVAAFLDCVASASSSGTSYGSQCAGRM